MKRNRKSLIQSEIVLQGNLDFIELNHNTNFNYFNRKKQIPHPSTESSNKSIDSETKKLQQEILQLESEIKGIEKRTSGDFSRKVDTTNEIRLKKEFIDGGEELNIDGNVKKTHENSINLN